MKQKVFDYIEELERKAKESEKYFKLWHEEKIKNNKAIEYIKSYMPNYDFDKTNLIKVLDILKEVEIKTITIPLNKVSYEDLEALTIEQQTQLFAKDKEIERLNNTINKAIEYIEQHNDYFLLKREVKKVLDILKGVDK